uniref:Fatty acyl-CoA reductase C-terminal domain-containing protein n=3 Tax=Pectinophora gossypiella TaxID=13191 RepID=A0A1E1WJ17_PECGO
MKPWHFKNDLYVSLRKRLSKEDDETFFTDIEVINWSDYIRNYMKGCREYCLKEDPSTLPQARRLNRQLYYLDIFAKAVICLLCLYFLYHYTVIFLSLLN